jgi:hypothetical protein
MIARPKQGVLPRAQARVHQPTGASMMGLRSTFAGVAVALAALVSGCQTTTVRSAWFDTEFTGPPLRKIVVSGGGFSTADGRVFEDMFVQKLRAAGVDAVAGYSAGLDEANLANDAFVAAVTKTGAQGLLFVRLLGVDNRTQISTTMVHGGMGWGRGPWGSWDGATRMMVPVQQVTQYDLAAVETKLFHVQTKQLIWAATTSTLNPTTVARETPAFADLIIGQLASRNIIERK